MLSDALSLPVFRHLFLSQLASGYSFAVFKDIVQLGRERAQRNGLACALVFDGERFCQLIEGDQPAVQQLARRIHTDPRHTGIQVLADGMAEDGPQLRQAWCSGYCDAEGLDPFDGTASPRGRAAVDSFVLLLRRCDLSN